MVDRSKMPDRSDTPFEKWALTEGIPIVRGYYVANAYEVPLKPWKRKGGLGALIVLEGGEGFSSAYICEIPPGESLKPQRHLFEEKIFILQGKGESRIWYESEKAQTFSWQENALFSPPLNVWHQHINTGKQPVKYVAVTDAPLVFNTYGNEDFIFGDNFMFKDRYNGQADYFDGKGRMLNKTTWAGGFIPDACKPFLDETIEYGQGFKVLSVELSENKMGSHLAQIEVGAYKKPHRHAAGAHLIITEGTGYALMWYDWDKKVKADFQRGTIYCPPEQWWHTHCNTGSQPVKQIALRCGIPGIGKIYQQRLGIKKGGDMLEREDEPHQVRKLFEDELAKKGLKSTMTW